MLERNRDLIDKLKAELAKVERDISALEKERDDLLSKKKMLLKEIGDHSDEKYEQDMLSLVYEQRKKSK
ncbi:MAG: hypothetical protein K6F00_06000 [Lachnospiraceae bacterium]|nr:hypothetical protein [Lachnospiraceae bacterium]